MGFLRCMHENKFVLRSRGVWGHAPPENFEIYDLRNAISWFFCGAFSINNEAKMQ